MIAWDVYKPQAYGFDKLIDTVFYDNDCDGEYVLNGLIDHDGYPANIYIYNNKTGETYPE